MSEQTKTMAHYRRHEKIREPYPAQHLTTLSEEWRSQVSKNKPTGPPAHLPGALVYDPFHGANVPMVHVEWDAAPAGCGSHSCWKGHTPGHGGPMESFQPAKASAPTLAFKRMSSVCWKQVASVEGSDA